MKKFLLLAAAALVGMSANAAQWYISGGFQGWSHCNANYELKETESGVFSINLETISGEFLICQGTLGNPDWNNKIGGVTITEADKAYTYIPGGGNFNLKVTVAPATVVVNTNNKTISINGASAENEYDTVYLVGDFGSGWNENMTTYPLSLVAGTDNVWEGEYTLTAATTYFKMRAGNYLYGTGGEDVAVVLGNEYTASQSGNSYSITPGAYNFQFVLDKNADTGVLKVTEAGNITIDYTKYYVNVLGTFNEWADNGVACDEEGVATVENLAIGTGEFKVKVWPGADPVIWYSNGEANAVDTPITITGNTEANMTIAGAAEGDVYNVTFDAKNGVMTIVKVVTEEPGEWPDLYVIGDFSGTAAQAAYKMTRNGNVYTYTFPNGITDNSLWFGTDGEPYWGFGPMEGGQVLNLNESVDAWFDYAFYGCFYSIDTNVSTKLTLTIPEGAAVEEATIPAILKVEGTVGFAELEAENGEATYFNLQGVRVANPENGMFIKVQGNKTSKVAL